MLLKEAKTDWLASKNIFYNTRTNQISDNINDLIEPEHIKFHPEGLCNYLDYGYSVYGQTILEDIRFLPPNSKIWVNENNVLQMEEQKDPFESTLGNSSTPEDTEEYIHWLVNNWIDQNEKRVIVPTSGGFDSRFINCMIDKKDCIHAYTYGISKKQDESMEVVYAKKLCELLGIEWKQIELGDFNQLMDMWYKVYGVSTHAHGMYHMEFYNAINQIEEEPCRVVSGIFGDIWSGNWTFSPVNHSVELENLAITHDMKADSEYCKLSGGTEMRDAFFEKNRKKLQDENWRIIIAARMKIILISYTLRIPEYYGFEAWSPFLDFGAVSRIINLDWEQKKRRKWQVEYFRRKNVLIGEMNLLCDYANCLNLMACLRYPPKPLNVKLLGTIMDESYVEKINTSLLNMTSEKLNYYYKYLVLYPIQRILLLKEYGRGKNQ